MNRQGFIQETIIEKEAILDYGDRLLLWTVRRLLRAYEGLMGA